MPEHVYTTDELKDFARQAAHQYGIPGDLFLRLITQESGWHIGALSPRGASGLGQFMPATWEGVWDQHPEIAEAFNVGRHPLNRQHPIASLFMSAAHLRDLYDSTSGTDAQRTRDMLIGYNAGPSKFGWTDAQLDQADPNHETTTYLSIILGGDNVSHEGGVVNTDPPEGGVESNAGDKQWTEAWQNFITNLDARIAAARQARDFKQEKDLLELRQKWEDRVVENANDFTLVLAEINADIQIRINAASEAGNRETQLALMELRGDIERDIKQMGIDADKWRLNKQQAFESAESEKGRDFSAEQAKLERENQQAISSGDRLSNLRQRSYR